MGAEKPIPADVQNADAATVSHSDDLRHVLTLAGLLVWEVNPRTHAMSWISGTNLIGELPLLDSLDDYLALHHPDDREAARDAFSRWLAGAGPLDIQHRLVLPSGRILWLHSRGAQRDAARESLVGVAQDITDYRQGEEDARILASVQGILETDASGDRILDEIGAVLCRHLDLAAVVFLAVSPAEDRLTMLHMGVSEDVPAVRPGAERALSAFTSPEIAAILATGTPVAVADIHADPRLVEQQAAFDAYGLRSVVGIPHIQAGRWTMLLVAAHHRPHLWRARETRLLAEISERVTLRLDRLHVGDDLRRSEERFRSLFETMDEGFCIIEMIYDDAGHPCDYRFVTVNPAFEHHTSLRDATGKRMREMIPAHEDDWFEIYGNVDRTRTPIRFVNEARELGGRWFDLNAFPFGDPSMHQVAVIFTDITERMRAEQSLREFENRVQRALEIDSVGIIFFNPDGPVTYANPAFLRMSGYTSDDVRNGIVRWDTMTPQEWMPSARHAIDEFLSLGRITPYEKEYIRKDGSRWWGLFAASRISEHEGVKFVIDISAMKRAEVERDRLADIVEDSNDAIIRCDPDGEIVDVNRATLQLYGYTKAEIVGKNIIDTAPPDRRDEFAAKYARLQCGEHVPPWETVRCDKHGSLLQVEIRMSPIRDLRGEIVGCSGVVRDITERKRLEQAQEDFLAMASHDLKSPVTVLLGRAQLMRRRKTYDDASIRTIIDQARRIERLATDLQHVVRLESGQLKLHLHPVDLAELVREAVDRFNALSSDFVFCTEMPDAPVIGQWDRGRIAQVIDNLLTNAVKYSPEGGTITVCVAPGDDGVDLRIVDEGIGIAPEFQRRLFTRFYRADINGVASGLGLGLYISRMLIEAHGGRIRVSSTPDAGSTFIVHLPWQVPGHEDGSSGNTDVDAAS